MPTLCPICNGLNVLQVNCDRCGSLLHDEGRIEQLYGPYSAYREIDHLKMTNGFPDLAHHQCVHVGNCPNCLNQQLLFIQEI